MKSYEKYISKEDVQKIHETSLKVLAEVGVIFEHPEIIELFKRQSDLWRWRPRAYAGCGQHLPSGIRQNP